MNDYKIYFTTLESINVESKGSTTENLTPLSHGDNTIDGIPFSLNLEEFYEGAYDNQIFKITPRNFNSEISLSTYALRYSFNQSAGQPKISMTLHSENNSIQPDWRFYDGDIINSALSLGEGQGVMIFPEKFVLLEKPESCRSRPYNQILLEETVKLIQLNCKTPCKPTFAKYGRKLNLIIQNLPLCKTNNETSCFSKAMMEARMRMTSNACTKLQYRVVQNSMFEEAPYQSTYLINMDMMVTVKQEYLICDGMALISFIGGVLGICIGTSFFSICGEAVRFLDLLIKWRKNVN